MKASLALAALLFPSVALAQPLVPPPTAPAPAPAPQPAPAPRPAPAPTPDPNAPANPYGQPGAPQPPPAYPNGTYQPTPAPTAGYQPLPANTQYVYKGQPAGQTEMIVDFGAVGLLTGITIDLRGVNDSSLGTMVVIGSTAGGGAVGWLLADRTDATRGDAYMTTLGLLVGAANGALLLKPLGDTHSGEQAMGVITLSSAIGTGAGFLASRGEKLTPGQGMFATNITLLGVGSAALIATIADNDGNHDNTALTTLAIGLDGGAAIGLAIAPKVNWSHRRASVVAMGTLAGTLVGGMVAGLVAPKVSNTDGTTHLSTNFVATSLLIGAWAGFGASILETGDLAPDPQYDPRFQQQAKSKPANQPLTVVPMVGPEGGGAMVMGTF